MYSRLLYLIALLITISPTNFCLAEKNTSQALKLGINIPLSGEVAEFGNAVKNGLEMARIENTKELSDILFFYEDNAYDGKKSISAFNKLRDFNNVDLIFIWGDTPSLAVAAVAERNKLPLIAVLTDPTLVRKMNYVIRFLNSYDQYAKALQEHLREKGYKKIAMLFIDIPYYRNSIEALKARLKEGEEIKLIDSYVLGDSDFKTSLLKIKSGKYDAMGIYLASGQIETVYRQAKSIALNIPTFGADDFESKTLIKNTKGAMEDAFYAMNIVKDEFKKRYLKLYKNNSHIGYGANAYQFALTLAKIKKSLKKDYTSDDIINAFKKFSKTDGVTGSYYFIENKEHGKYFHFPVAVKKIKNGEIKVLSVR